ncbi:DUF1569 domain-containing protein [Halobacillus karajensis]|uniref:DUF1569 domain-containing protein n=1 Tax=Halobacillus karajensis TaxID=195088 RepID=A0A024P890_9BACI|nr:DUF1569 domain-containing protein [Halobacillus karajensis]CDQ20271.1 hypothetical protein BN982_02594 [Halobacillus karajensis]CDQ25068.1 hypothetical protein BN983_03373 [Halobacillus karajensis]CDQ28571.1 hypothetical protein BN981_02879 [Halobacillus karajensis]
MNNIFEITYTDEILNRIENLNVNSQPKWGKMDVSQMLAHCSSFQDIAMGYSFPPRGWLGLLVGRFAKPIFYNDKPLDHNMSTIPTILITCKRDFGIEREKLKQKIIIFQKNGPEACTDHPHPFFGKLISEQWGKGIYKHLDHHLKQFDV